MKRLTENLVSENQKRYSRDEKCITQDSVNIPESYGVICPRCGSTHTVMTTEEYLTRYDQEELNDLTVYWQGYRVVCGNCDYDPVCENYENNPRLCYPEEEPRTEKEAIRVFLKS